MVDGVGGVDGAGLAAADAGLDGEAWNVGREAGALPSAARNDLGVEGDFRPEQAVQKDGGAAAGEEAMRVGSVRVLGGGVDLADDAFAAEVVVLRAAGGGGRVNVELFGADAAGFRRAAELEGVAHVLAQMLGAHHHPGLEEGLFRVRGVARLAPLVQLAAVHLNGGVDVGVLRTLAGEVFADDGGPAAKAGQALLLDFFAIDGRLQAAVHDEQLFALRVHEAAQVVVHLLVFAGSAGKVHFEDWKSYLSDGGKKTPQKNRAVANAQYFKYKIPKLFCICLLRRWVPYGVPYRIYPLGIPQR